MLVFFLNKFPKKTHPKSLKFCYKQQVSKSSRNYFFFFFSECRLIRCNAIENIFGTENLSSKTTKFYIANNDLMMMCVVLACIYTTLYVYLELNLPCFSLLYRGTYLYSCVRDRIEYIVGFSVCETRERCSKIFRIFLRFTRNLMNLRSAICMY